MISSILKNSKIKKITERIVAILFALLVWQVVADVVDKQILIASPLSVAKRICELALQKEFWTSAMTSLSKIAAGFLIALILGILFASVSGKFHIIEVMLWPFMVTARSVPVASFIIICLIWLSSYKLSIFISFLMVFPIVYANVLQGIKNTDKKLLEMADVFRVKAKRKLLNIYIPSVRPFLISSCEIALGMAWKSGIAAEVIGIPEGSIGEMLYEAKVYLDTDDLFAWTVVIVVLSVLFEKLFMLLLKGFFRGIKKV